MKMSCFLQLHLESQPSPIHDIGMGAAGDLFELADLHMVQE